MAKELLGVSIDSNGAFNRIKEYYSDETNSDEVRVENSRIIVERSGITGQNEKVVYHETVKPILIIDVQDDTQH